jgi:hypothetical protein
LNRGRDLQYGRKTVQIVYCGVRAVRQLRLRLFVIHNIFVVCILLH